MSKINIYKCWYYVRHKPTEQFPNLNIVEYNVKFKVLPNISIKIDKNGCCSRGNVIFRFEWLFWYIPITIVFKSKYNYKI